MTYTLLHSTILARGSGPNPWGAPGVAVLSDGTFLAAVQMQDAIDSIFIQHLASDLTVLGSTSIAGTLGSDYPAPYLVATKNKQAVLIWRMGWTVQTFFTAVIDCSGGLSVGSALPMATAYAPALDGFGVSHFYDPATDRIVLWSGPLQVFSAITGALLSETSTPLNAGIGLYMDPADHTKFTLMDTATRISTPQQAHLIVALDGLSCSYDDSVNLVHPPSYWPFVVGDPYAASGPGMIADSSSGDGSQPVNYYGADGSVLATYVMVGSEYVNMVGQPTAMLNYAQPIVYAEMGNVTGTVVLGSYVLEGALFAANPSVVPVTLEKVVLPYLGGGGVSVGTLVSLIAADQTTGIILIGATSVNFQDATTNLWVVQGPAMLPNLTGQLLDDRVRFT